MNKKRLIIASIIIFTLAITLPLFNITLPLGNPNLGSTPATLAAVFLPWPICIIAGILKGIAASIFTGKWLVEMPAGIGDAMMATLTFWLAKRLNNSLAATLGQISRYIFSSGMIALSISIAIATGVISPETAPVSGLTSSVVENMWTVWKSISCPAITLSIVVNLALSLLVIMIFQKHIQKALRPGNSV